eukprot:COSAG02_NODE_2668_length_8293_cov_23.094825_5_plen_145_part_00
MGRSILVADTDPRWCIRAMRLGLWLWLRFHFADRTIRQMQRISLPVRIRDDSSARADSVQLRGAADLSRLRAPLASGVALTHAMAAALFARRGCACVLRRSDPRPLSDESVPRLYVPILSDGFPMASIGSGYDPDSRMNLLRQE